METLKELATELRNLVPHDFVRGPKVLMDVAHRDRLVRLLERLADEGTWIEAEMEVGEIWSHATPPEVAAAIRRAVLQEDA